MYSTLKPHGRRGCITSGRGQKKFLIRAAEQQRRGDGIVKLKKKIGDVAFRSYKGGQFTEDFTRPYGDLLLCLNVGTAGEEGFWLQWLG